MSNQELLDIRKILSRLTSLIESKMGREPSPCEEEGRDKDIQEAHQLALDVLLGTQDPLYAAQEIRRLLRPYTKTTTTS